MHAEPLSPTVLIVLSDGECHRYREAHVHAWCGSKGIIVTYPLLCLPAMANVGLSQCQWARTALTCAVRDLSHESKEETVAGGPPAPASSLQARAETEDRQPFGPARPVSERAKKD